MCEDKRESAKDVHWNCIVITCSNHKFKHHIERETLKLTKAGLLPSHDLLIVVDDPQPSPIQNQNSSCGVGSGGATINALLIVAERLSSLASKTTIDGEVLHKNLILLVHFGRNSFHYAGGNAFFPLSSSASWVPPSLCSPKPPTLLEHSIWMASYLATRSEKGVWITSLDFFLPYNSTITAPDTSVLEGALICSLSCRNLMDISNNHGFLTSDSSHKIQQITYKKVISNCDVESDARISNGSTFLSCSVAESIFSLYVLPPLDRCTYYGTDTGTESVQVSLYFDLLLPLCNETNEEKYISGELSSSYALGASYSTLMHQEGVVARQHIWNKLHHHFAFEFPLIADAFAVYLNPDHSISSTLEHVLSVSPNNESEKGLKVISYNSLVKCKMIESNKCKMHVFNCFFGPGITLEVDGHCMMTNFYLPFTNPLSIKTGKRIAWQCWYLASGDSVVTCHGFDDFLTIDRRDEGFSMCNRTWKEVSSFFKLTPEDIWHRDSCQTLLEAKLFTSSLNLMDQISVMQLLTRCATDSKTNLEDQSMIDKWKESSRRSFKEVLSNCDFESQLADNVFIESLESLIKETRNDMMGPSLVPRFKYVTAMSFERSLNLIMFFHEVLQHYSPSSSRLLANVADILGCLAGLQGGLRSGPAGNKKWSPALTALKEGSYEEGIKLLAATCYDFVKNQNDTDIIIRASRHYERASHIMISKQVETTRLEVSQLLGNRAPTVKLSKAWVKATCPARLDLAGGWTDTPPICYELGGAVLNVAIKVNGKRPIGAKGRITEQPDIVCILVDSSGNEMTLLWNDLEELKDYDNPVSPGALVKACLVYSKFVSLEGERNTLKEQLERRYGGGLEIWVWSELAQGSGLGGSSLLAGTILSVLFVVMGFEPPTTRQLIHATLGVEQLLTTGGGWQDQVGGLIGGIKLGVSYQRIPLVVDTFCIPLSEELLAFINQRLLLVYTGKVRLARNLLQTVLRNWYAGETIITTCFHRLRKLALKAAQSVLDEDVAQLGACIDEYWDLKRSVASGCEPDKVNKFMKKIGALTLGQSLAGAGGGGYLYGLTRDPLVNLDYLMEEFKDMKSDTAEIDTDGLVVSVDDKVIMRAGIHGDLLTTGLFPRILQRFENN